MATWLPTGIDLAGLAISTSNDQITNILLENVMLMFNKVNKVRDIKVGLSTMIFLITLFIAVVITGPLLVIWSLNTIFTLGIPYDIYTWSAVAILVIAINSGFRSK